MIKHQSVCIKVCAFLFIVLTSNIVGFLSSCQHESDSIRLHYYTAAAATDVERERETYTYLHRRREISVCCICLNNDSITHDKFFLFVRNWSGFCEEKEFFIFSALEGSTGMIADHDQSVSLNLIWIDKEWMITFFWREIWK